MSSNRVTRARASVLLVWTSAAFAQATLDESTVGDVGNRLTAASNGPVFYVAATGDDKASCESAKNIKTPKRTVAGALTCLTPGSTLLIGKGAYPSFALRGLNGTASGRITIKSLGDGKVTIDQHLGGTAAPRTIEFFASSYITIDGLSLTDSDPNIDTHRKCDVVNNLQGCAELWAKNFLGRTGVKLSPSNSVYPKHITLTNLEIYHVAGGPLGGKAYNVEISNNHIYDNGVIGSASGMYVYGDRLLIKGNKSHDNNGDGIRTGSEPGAETYLTNSIIENNVSFNNNRTHINYVSFPPEVRVLRHGGEGIIIWNGYGNTIRNNVIYGNSSWGIRVRGSPPFNNHVYNNTIYRNGRQGIYMYETEPIDVINNISFGSLGTGQYAGELHIGGNNIASHNFSSDPNFVNASKGDFHLQPGSLLVIDKGTQLKNVTRDIDGTPRPQGKGYDIGAYEFKVGAPPTPKPPENFSLR